MNFLDDLHQRLVFSKNNSILDCPITESKYIVIDSDQFEVKVYSSESSKPFLVEKPIGLVDSLVQSVLSMIDLFQNSEFVLLHLEDKLQEFYTKSLAMSQIKSQSQEISDEKLMKLIDINDVSDLEFLRQIHSAVKIPDFF
ncbi:unnamed protein product [Brachionus calyciflorus]|uniref:UDENN FNIP1/2-type domain-containing protein n=1 Tax=Brachionus calyciflorus TaxID=104777 RepID=A0A814EJL7_9BILA|nr:unnamed protein product [Brachionus calyciflorus]